MNRSGRTKIAEGLAVFIYCELNKVAGYPIGDTSNERNRNMGTFLKTVDRRRLGIAGKKLARMPVVYFQ